MGEKLWNFINHLNLSSRINKRSAKQDFSGILDIVAVTATIQAAIATSQKHNETPLPIWSDCTNKGLSYLVVYTYTRYPLYPRLRKYFPMEFLRLTLLIFPKSNCCCSSSPIWGAIHFQVTICWLMTNFRMLLYLSFLASSSPLCQSYKSNNVSSPLIFSQPLWFLEGT